MTCPSSVLLVDGAPELSELLAVRLRRAGHLVLRVADGIEASAALAGGVVPSLVLCAWDPGALGWVEGTASLRAAAAARNIAVLLLTADDAPPDLMGLVAAGRLSWAREDTPWEQLATLIAAATAGETALVGRGALAARGHRRFGHSRPA